MGYGPSPVGPYAPPPRRGSRLAVSLATLAVLLGAAALVVSLVREPAAPASSPPTTTTATAPAQQVFVEEADRSLCEAIAPLMKENDEKTREFSQFKAGSPEQSDALPGYRNFTEAWAARIQSVLHEQSDPPRYLTRTLQRFIDDMLLYVNSDSVSDEVGVNTWKLSLSDYGGPASVCRKLGVNWQ